MARLHYGFGGSCAFAAKVFVVSVAMMVVLLIIRLWPTLLVQVIALMIVVGCIFSVSGRLRQRLSLRVVRSGGTIDRCGFECLCPGYGLTRWAGRSTRT